MKILYQGEEHCPAEIHSGMIISAVEFEEEIKMLPEVAVCAAGEAVTEEMYRPYREGEEICLEEEGRWRVFFRLCGQDGAVQVCASEEVVIDRKAPKIFVSNVEHEMSYRYLDHITVQIEDENISEKEIQTALFNESGTLFEREEKRESSRNRTEVTIGELGNLPDGDYTFSVQVQDVGGNKTESEIEFRLNSAGSAYFLSGGARKLSEKYYVKEGSSFSIIEKNVDKLQKRAVTCVKNGKFYLLREGMDYQVNCREETAGWRYEYLLLSKNFQEEGFYSIVLQSEDRAGNQNDSRTMCKMEFFVDQTAPVSFLVGLEPEETAGTAREIRLCARDEGRLKLMELWQDGKKVLSTTQEEYSDQIFLQEGVTEFQILARDFAGNQTWSEKYVVHAGGKTDQTEKNISFAGFLVLLMLWILVLIWGIRKMVRENSIV